MAFISKSNCEYEVSGRMSKKSLRSSLAAMGDVGGVVNWEDWMEERDGEDAAFMGLVFE